MLQNTTQSTREKILRTLRGQNVQERELHRLHSIALVLSGVPAKAVARFYGDSPRAVAYWVTKFKSSGFESLKEKKRTGRPSSLTASQMIKLRSFVKAKRSKGENVNAATLAAHIKASFHVCLTERQCWRILKEID